MMKGRNLINLFGIPCWLFLIWKGELYYLIFIFICIVLGLGEFYTMLEAKNTKPLRWVGMVVSVFIVDYYYVQPDISPHAMIGCIILLVLLTYMWELFTNNSNPILNIVSTFAGIIYIPLLLGTAIDIRQFDLFMDTNITFALVISVWICDSTAFILGTLYGKKKILPAISPNKSLVGSVSGFLASLLVCLFFHNQGWLGSYFSIQDAVVFGIITGFFGQLGDFTESLFKRDVGVKDSGTILAGHGGILDRFDSLLFAMPITYLYIHFILGL